MLTSCLCGQQLEPGQMRCQACQALYDGSVSRQAILDQAFEAAQARLAARDDDATLDDIQPIQQSAPGEPMRQPQRRWYGKNLRNGGGND